MWFRLGVEWAEMKRFLQYTTWLLKDRIIGNLDVGHLFKPACDVSEMLCTAEFGGGDASTLGEGVPEQQ